jgi:hypothetical protein
VIGTDLVCVKGFLVNRLSGALNRQSIYGHRMSLRENLSAIAQLTLYAAAGIMALLSGLVFFPIVVLGLLSIASLWREPTITTFAIAAWSLFSGYAAVRNAVAFIDLMNVWDGRQWVLTLLWSVVALATCPLLWTVLIP